MTQPLSVLRIIVNPIIVALLVHREFLRPGGRNTPFTSADRIAPPPRRPPNHSILAPLMPPGLPLPPATASTAQTQALTIPGPVFTPAPFPLVRTARRTVGGNSSDSVVYSPKSGFRPKVAQEGKGKGREYQPGVIPDASSISAGSDCVIESDDSEDSWMLDPMFERLRASSLASESSWFMFGICYLSILVKARAKEEKMRKKARLSGKHVGRM